MTREAHTHYVRPLRKLADEDPDRFYVVSKAVAELEGHPGWAFVLELLDGRERQLMTQFANDAASMSHEDLVRLSGEMHALRAASRAQTTVLVVAAERERRLAQAAAVAAGE
jgi:hypothetical protein